MVIYKTTNLINNKIYVGQDKHNCPTYLGSGKVLRQAILKYGIENFKKEILSTCESKKILDKLEIFWIEKLNAGKRGIGYNIAKGGEGGDVFTNKTKEEKEITRKRISIASKKMWLNENYRESHSKMSKKNQTDERRKSHSKKIKKLYENPLQRKKLSVAMKKVKHTEEWNKKVGFNNVVRFHAKKIEYVLSQGINEEIVASFFKVPVEKIKNLKKFEKEPNIEILLESYNLYKNGKSHNYILRNLKDAPNYGQFNIFKRLCEVK